MSDVTIEHIFTPKTESITPISALEADAFGLGGLNEWHLPIIARRGRLYVAKDKEVTIGAASVIRDWNPAVAFLIDLTVDSKRRRQGVGESLMATIIRDFSAEGIERLELTVAVDNEAANGLYEKLGFAAVALWPDEYGAGQSRRLLRLELRHLEGLVAK